MSIFEMNQHMFLTILQSYFIIKIPELLNEKSCKGKIIATLHQSEIYYRLVYTLHRF